MQNTSSIIADTLFLCRKILTLFFRKQILEIYLFVLHTVVFSLVWFDIHFAITTNRIADDEETIYKNNRDAL